MFVQPLCNKPNHVPEPCGKNSQSILLRPGLELFISNFRVTKSERIHFVSPVNVCELCFILSSNISGGNDAFKRQINVLPFSTALWLTPRLDCYADYLSGSDVCFICVRIKRALLVDMMGEYLNQISEEFRRILENRQDRLYYRSAGMTLYMQESLRQIIECPYHGTMKKIFLEGKALELISSLLTYHFGGAAPPNKPLPVRDRKKIHLAREILIKRMDSPPPLTELAKSAGISETKLKSGFRKEYGTSVFAWLRKQRLEKAHLLLTQGDLNITEIAYATGYSSIGHFSNTFKQHYGTSPTIYLKDH